MLLHYFTQQPATDRPQPSRAQRKGSPTRRRRSRQRKGEEGQGGCESCQGGGEEEWRWEGVLVSNYTYVKGGKMGPCFEYGLFEYVCYVSGECRM